MYLPATTWWDDDHDESLCTLRTFDAHTGELALLPAGVADCGICLEQVTDGSLRICPVPRCAGRYHDECVRLWFDHLGAGPRLCPHCRGNWCRCADDTGAIHISGICCEWMQPIRVTHYRPLSLRVFADEDGEDDDAMRLARPLFPRPLLVPGLPPREERSAEEWMDADEAQEESRAVTYAHMDARRAAFNAAAAADNARDNGSMLGRWYDFFGPPQSPVVSVVDEGIARRTALAAAMGAAGRALGRALRLDMGGNAAVAMLNNALGAARDSDDGPILTGITEALTQGCVEVTRLADAADRALYADRVRAYTATLVKQPASPAPRVLRLRRNEDVDTVSARLLSSRRARAAASSV